MLKKAGCNALGRVSWKFWTGKYRKHYLQSILRWPEMFVAAAEERGDNLIAGTWRRVLWTNAECEL